MATGRGQNERIIVKAQGKDLEQVSEFKYLGATITENAASEKEIKNRVGIGLSTLPEMNAIWRAKTLKVKGKIKLMRAIVVSIILYRCENWTLTDKIWRKLQAFEMKCCRRVLGITWQEKRTNEDVLKLVADNCDGSPPERLMKVIKKENSHFSDMRLGATKTLMQGMYEGRRYQGRTARIWFDDIKDWTGLDGK